MKRVRRTGAACWLGVFGALIVACGGRAGTTITGDGPKDAAGSGSGGSIQESKEAGTAGAGGANAGAGTGGDGSAPSDGTIGNGCSINADCNNPLICAFQRCHAPCGDSRDCPVASRCVKANDLATGASLGTVCQLPEESAIRCDKPTDCPGAQVCGIDAKCRDECAQDSDCIAHQTCTDHTCADASELNDTGMLDGVRDGGAP